MGSAHCQPSALAPSLLLLLLLLIPPLLLLLPPPPPPLLLLEFCFCFVFLCFTFWPAVLRESFSCLLVRTIWRPLRNKILSNVLRFTTIRATVDSILDLIEAIVVTWKPENGGKAP